MLDNKFILLAEDAEDEVVLLQRAFRKAGLGDVLKVVNDGAQAIDYLSGQGVYADRQQFPLPFLDLLILFLQNRLRLK